MSVKCFLKDHSDILVWSIKSVTENLKFSLKTLKSPLPSIHSFLLCMHFFHSQVLDKGFQCHLKISALAISPEAAGGNRVSCSQIWRQWIFCSQPLHFLIGKLVYFLSPLSFSLPISFFLCSLWSFSYTLATTQCYCSMFDTTQLSYLRMFCFLLQYYGFQNTLNRKTVVPYFY